MFCVLVDRFSRRKQTKQNRFDEKSEQKEMFENF